MPPRHSPLAAPASCGRTTCSLADHTAQPAVCATVPAPCAALIRWDLHWPRSRPTWCRSAGAALLAPRVAGRPRAVCEPVAWRRREYGAACPHEPCSPCAHAWPVSLLVAWCLCGGVALPLHGDVAIVRAALTQLVNIVWPKPDETPGKVRRPGRRGGWPSKRVCVRPQHASTPPPLPACTQTARSLVVCTTLLIWVLPKELQLQQRHLRFSHVCFLFADVVLHRVRNRWC